MFGLASQNVVDFLYTWYNRFAAAEDRDFCDRWREHQRRLVYVPDAVVRGSNPRASTWRCSSIRSVVLEAGDWPPS